MDLPTRVTPHLRSAHGLLPGLARRSLSPCNPSRWRQARVFALAVAVLFPVFGAAAAQAAQQKPAPETPIAKNLRFPLTSKDDKETVAEVTVERIAKDTHKKTLSEIMRFDWFSGVVADGVSVRFQRLNIQALPGLPEKLRALAKVKRIEIHHLSIYAPGDSVPRLIAGEVETRPDGTWSLKRVLLADRASMNNCTLSISVDGEIRIATALGKPLALRSLLTEIDNPAFVSSPVDLSNPQSTAGANLAPKSPLAQEMQGRMKR